LTVDRPALHPPRQAVREVRLFASARQEPRSRRFIDAVAVVVALALLIVLAWWAQPTRDFEQALIEATAASPSWLHNVWVVMYDLVVLLAVVVLVAAAVRSRWPLLLLCLVAAVVAAVIVAVVTWALTDQWPSVESAVGLDDPVAWPAAALTLASAVLLSVSSDVTAPARRFGGRALAVAALASVLASRTTPTGVLAALLAATAAAAVARLVVGTAAGHHARDEVRGLLDALGLTGIFLDRFDRQDDGVVLVAARGEDGQPLLIKVLGRDVAERRRAERIWRSLIYRDGGASFAGARQPGLDRETLATLIAETNGVPVWRVVTAGRPVGAGEALVLVRDGERLADVAEGAFGDEAAVSAWHALRTLHDARIAHLDLGPQSLALRADGTVALTDFTDAVTAAPDELMRTDDAQLLAMLALLLGPERAVASARAVLSADELAGLLPYLQRPALPGELRGAVRRAKLDMEALRKAVAEAAGVEAPELANLQRVTWGGLVSVGLLILAAAVIVPFIAGLDYDELAEAFRDASLPLLVFGFLLAQTPRLAQAVSTLGSVPARLPYFPVYILQLATSFMNVALPSAAARMAITVRFFQRQGLAPATAVMSGLVDSFVGNVVQAILLVCLLLFSSLSLDLDSASTDSSSSSSGDDTHWLILLIVAVFVACIVALVVSRRLRQLVMARLRSWWPDVKAAAQPLHNRRNLAQLLGGNIAAEVLFASALAVFVYAFGGEVTLVEALFVNVSAGLITMVVPVPGGIGITESALIVGLTSVGVEETVAFAAVIGYRLSTFYLPPIWGYVAMRWLGKNGYL
jgi:uncharacterized membrane protein YbhN (UPF0104 family)